MEMFSTTSPAIKIVAIFPMVDLGLFHSGVQMIVISVGSGNGVTHKSVYNFSQFATAQLAF